VTAIYIFASYGERFLFIPSPGLLEEMIAKIQLKKKGATGKAKAA
jgi:hypothetical protein